MAENTTNGKGSRPRSNYSKQFRENYEAIFYKTPCPCLCHSNKMVAIYHNVKPCCSEPFKKFKKKFS